jgi:hypothetical protein
VFFFCTATCRVALGTKTVALDAQTVALDAGRVALDTHTELLQSLYQS